MKCKNINLQGEQAPIWTGNGKFCYTAFCKASKCKYSTYKCKANTPNQAKNCLHVNN